MRAVIICGGDVGDYINDYVTADDFVICADSGYDKAMEFGITPDVVMGDMDSTKRKDYPEDSIIFPVRKDATDSELAVNYALERGYKSALLFGMTGSRLDHSLANITLLGRFDKGCIINKNNEIYFVKKSITLSGRTGDIISIIPYPADISGVTTEGLDYPLLDGEIKAGTSRGVSNEMTADVCTITISKGTAFVIRSRD